MFLVRKQNEIFLGLGLVQDGVGMQHTLNDGAHKNLRAAGLMWSLSCIRACALPLTCSLNLAPNQWTPVCETKAGRF